MPELPEVEVVRRGLADHASGRSIHRAIVYDRRSVRRHPGEMEAFEAELFGTRLGNVVRRGKYLWFEIPSGLPDETPRAALVAHLGMSGQFLVKSTKDRREPHLKISLALDPLDQLPNVVRFIDQRIFGGLFISPLVPTHDGAAGGLGTDLALVPDAVAHVGRDVLDPVFDGPYLASLLASKPSAIKRVLLDQSVVSGVGNIYADEALWRAKIHYLRSANALKKSQVFALAEALKDVMNAALEAGGTSFDALYVNVNGASGYFDRSLNAYGRAGEPCKRCAAEGRETLMKRDAFMGRGSYWCPKCQPKPRPRLGADR
ncbi:bifunctional DNA-formamidopyrimidine glycosylase/DNA-(apurinic or apyrimidinic site) lyase [Neomicrococcus lactis]|uniref:Formamidopyrimidine-DNA glycosylase n=1 Tax=Neomicrococcus lactis TaxID=732241 RepID=A0A7W9DB62_9MICC|nr:bifunctional DNA-formamidopyrimidine glycosylase/DNA-(apurinic or apyrimidinic site) lyase [Neomicrococcus lactis]MBB5597517.1 formamidopyrimidine-DNA glycosylase [Neomicrococcus lactis]